MSTKVREIECKLAVWYVLFSPTLTKKVLLAMSACIRQWAAVTTQDSLSREPPQKGCALLRLADRYISDTYKSEEALMEGSVGKAQESGFLALVRLATVLPVAPFGESAGLMVLVTELDCTLTRPQLNCPEAAKNKTRREDFFKMAAVEPALAVQHHQTRQSLMSGKSKGKEDHAAKGECKTRRTAGSAKSHEHKAAELHGRSMAFPLRRSTSGLQQFYERHGCIMIPSLRIELRTVSPTSVPAAADLGGGSSPWERRRAAAAAAGEEGEEEEEVAAAATSPVPIPVGARLLIC
ncbi:unnamed protein product [Menidia menidia]|uniref:(Atlantic silverside) hypothetical protein n=1 Tax=Menidia menidia TaxID=238744 RepID=A0A8S4AJ73_9TELE|nr:unnamed protein product [Menidia menidia]